MRLVCNCAHVGSIPSLGIARYTDCIISGAVQVTFSVYVALHTTAVQQLLEIPGQVSHSLLTFAYIALAIISQMVKCGINEVAMECAFPKEKHCWLQGKNWGKCNPLLERGVKMSNWEE